MLPIFALLLAAPSPPTPATPEQDDIACAAFFSISASDAETDVDRNDASLAAAYFIGKIDGRRPGADSLKLITDYAKRVSRSDIAAQQGRCSTEFVAVGGNLVLLGAAGNR